MNPVDEMVLQAKHGNRTAFDTLFVRHQPRILAYCTRLLKSAPDGEQAAQDVFLLAWVRLESFRFESPFENWLMRIATHTCLNLRRTQSDKDATRAMTLDNPDTLAVVEARLSKSQMEDAVLEQVYAKQLLQKIRVRAQTAKPCWDELDWHIFHLLYEQRIETIREVAYRLEKSEDTVKYRIYKRINVVLNAVREEVNEEEVALQHTAR